MEKLRDTVAKRVYELRNERNLTPTVFAQRASISRSHLRSIEKGEVNVTADTLDKILGAFGMTSSEFFK